MNIDIRTKICPICSSRQSFRLSANIIKNYRAIRCNNCDIETIDPLSSFESQQRFYNNYALRKSNDKIGPEFLILYEKIFSYLLKKIKSNKKKLFLDYGFGTGAFLKFVAQKGYKTVGVEFDDYYCKILSEYSQKYDLDISTINIQTRPLSAIADYKYDCITLFSVIEHMKNPLELLSSLSKLQSKGGIIYIECPNNDALYLKVKNKLRSHIGRKNHYNSLNPPQHLYGFNQKSLTVLLQRAGYKIVEIKNFPIADKVHEIESINWYPSFIDLIKKRHYRSFYQFSKFLTRLIDPLLVPLKRSVGIYAVAKKIK